MICRISFRQTYILHVHRVAQAVQFVEVRQTSLRSPGLIFLLRLIAFITGSDILHSETVEWRGTREGRYLYALGRKFPQFGGNDDDWLGETSDSCVSHQLAPPKPCAPKVKGLQKAKGLNCSDMKTQVGGSGES